MIGSLNFVAPSATGNRATVCGDSQSSAPTATQPTDLHPYSAISAAAAFAGPASARSSISSRKNAPAAIITAAAANT